MMIEGFVMLQHRGRYAIYNQGGLYHELKYGDQIEVETGEGWIQMQVDHDFEGYYLESKRISFYPKRVYARLTVQGGEENGET